jgi:hypothetical protein
MTALEREWAAKLAASGFQDLEGRDRDGPLSDRGNLHTPTHGDGEYERLAERIEHGSAYHRWAQDVLRTHRFASRFQREAWAVHADGLGYKETARKLGVNYHRARNALMAVRDQAKRVNQVREHAWHERKLRQLVKRSDPATLTRLASLLIRTRPL